MDNRALRLGLRNRRRQLPRRTHQQAAQRAYSNLLQLPLFIRSQRLAAYIADDGELDLAPAIDYCHQTQKRLVIPVVHPCCSRRLLFAEYDQQANCQFNRYRIPEPNLQHAIASWTLDCVLVPLVAFNDNGYRLGRGGGYYDSTFNSLQRANTSKPKLIGCGYDWQRNNDFSVAAWDVPLHAIVTDKKLYYFGDES